MSGKNPIDIRQDRREWLKTTSCGFGYLALAGLATEAAAKDAAKTASAKFFSTIDKAVKAGRLHKNAANRHKSRLNTALAKLA